MKFFEFPLLGTRAISEFVPAHDEVLEPINLADNVSAGDWVYERDSVPKITTEFWYHSTSQIWFKVERNTGTNQIYSAEVLRE